MLRCGGDFSCLAALTHDKGKITTGLILQAEEEVAGDIKAMLRHHRGLIGEALLLPTIIMDISLDKFADSLLKTKEKIKNIENATKQHTWKETGSDTKSQDKQDFNAVKTMRSAHGLKIEVANAYREIGVVSSLIDLLEQTYKDDGADDKIEQWIKNLKVQVKMVMTDVDYLQRRTENQVAAVRLVVFLSVLKANQRN
jgi:predicted DNA binding CopG/RHH family protein